MKFYQESQEKVSEYYNYIFLLMSLVFGRYSNYMVTDGSILDDFGLSESAINTLSKKLGFKVKKEDHIWKIAKKMKVRALRNSSQSPK